LARPRLLPGDTSVASLPFKDAFLRGRRAASSRCPRDAASARSIYRCAAARRMALLTTTAHNAWRDSAGLLPAGRQQQPIAPALFNTVAGRTHMFRHNPAWSKHIDAALHLRGASSRETAATKRTSLPLQLAAHNGGIYFSTLRRQACLGEHGW